MTRLSGARAAAGLAQDVMLRLHGALRTDLVAGDFAAPPGRVETEVCAVAGSGGACAQRASEWVRPGEAAPSAPSPRLAIVRPDTNTHLWRNPDLPARLNRLVLHAAVQPPVPQIVWLVNGVPVSVGAPDAPLVWTMQPGRFRFQVRLPLQQTASAPVTVVVD